MNQPATLDERLRFAIANRRLMQVTYKGRARVGEPHDYGRRHGTSRLLFYQLREAGGAGGARTSGWRLLELSKIEDGQVLDGTFGGSRGPAHRQHLTWDELFARVT